jgi:DNA-binding NarL/FixJ family response regulator
MINVAIADDQLLFRKGMIALANDFSNMRIVMEAENGKDLLEQLENKGIAVQVLLLDISMPDMNGVETINELHQRFPNIKVIILSIHSDEMLIAKMIESGANGYLVKNAQPEEVRLAIETVVEKDFYFNDQTLQAMRKGLQSKRKKITLNAVDSLTSREKEVLELICKEYTTPEIARKLYISERTVDGHRNNLILKTGARNTAGLVVFAMKNNVLEPRI